MNGFLDYINMSFIDWPEAALRIALAMLFGLILGLDRDSKNKPIDFRAYMIVCVTSCLVAMIGQELYADYAAAEKALSIDLAKIISGVLTGIGFLGAGAIMKRGENEIVGTATGASIWAAGGIGLALGFGFYGLSLIAFIAIAVILIIGGYFMPKVTGKKDKEKKKS